MSADELLRYRHEPYRTELIAGRLHETEPTGGEHGLVAGQVTILLGTHVRRHGLGRLLTAEAGFRLACDPDTVRAPDVAFITRERAEAIGRPHGYIPGAPDLAIEIVSPSDRPSAVEAKVRDWLAAGALAVLVLDPPAQTAAVHRPSGSTTVLRGEDRLELDDVVPGWAPFVAHLFA